MKQRLASTAFLALALAAPALTTNAAPAPGPASNPAALGEWVVQDGSARIAIARCKDALCGSIAWIKYVPGKDEKNPDPAKRDRSVLGLQILNDLKPTAPGKWEGTVYNPQNGSTYVAVVTMKGDNTLRMEGCVLGGLLCGGEDWTRYKEPQQAKTGAAASQHAKSTPAPAKDGKDVKSADARP